MRKRLAVTLAILAIGVSTLTGCNPAEESRKTWLERERDYIQLGKECYDEGGQWVYNPGSGGWLCEFRRFD